MKHDYIEMYRGGAGRIYYWRYVRRNGKILADSGEGYHRRIDCLNAIAYLFDAPADIKAWKKVNADDYRIKVVD